MSLELEAGNEKGRGDGGQMPPQAEVPTAESTESSKYIWRLLTW